ncbi:MAG TPA: copper-binding protein [Pyrinomonadaceae bacterium]|nr:copper-binding protein [Pyrinomonadaceae bacterium]
MIRTLLLILACVSLAFGAACAPANHTTNNATPSPSASGSAAPGVTSKGYPGEGTVKALDPKASTIEIDHGDIEGLMPAMQMEFDVTDPALLNGIAVNDRIDFTVEDHAGTMRVTAIKKK